MKIYAINGSPRKGWNTETMLQNFLDGASSVSSSVETQMVHLYDLNYKGCISCFGCQRDNDSTYGQCQVKDGIYDLLRDVPLSDGVAFASPIYLHDLTAGLRAFIERLVYQYLSFEVNKEKNNAPKRLYTAMIYTMNVSEEVMKRDGYPLVFDAVERFLRITFEEQPLRLCAYNTYQFNEYSKYRVSYWNEPQKAEWRRTQFPLDCRAAYNAGRDMALKIL